jgi:predicted AlkP superfamily pyrophosphatase or phosphodiesterase
MRIVSVSKRIAAALLFLLCIREFSYSASAAPSDIAPVVTTPHGPNATSERAKRYLVLVSLDGFRFDYAQKYGAPYLIGLGKRGIAADALMPAYPSLTFPNHYSIVTGLYPEHHGIVGMNFYDPALRKHFSYRDPKAVTDGTWYRGTPLWVLAEKQGMRTACFFWPGSEAEIDGMRPTYYVPFNDRFPDEDRIQQVLQWLQLPESDRPHFITLYYSAVDHAGHEFGPDSKQVADAVHHVDDLIGKLASGLEKLSLPIDVVVVSDHGMENEQGASINLDTFADLTGFETDGSFLYPQDEKQAEKTYRQLSVASDKFTVYRRRDVPSHLHYNDDARIGDPVIVANGPYVIRAHGDSDHVNKGVHGYDPAHLPNMRGIFYAAGPGIREHVRLEPFENVDIYPFITQLLGLKMGKIDGSDRVLQPFLVETGVSTKSGTR